MSVVSQEFIGNYRKLRNCSGIVYGHQPRKLNENQNLYGVLRNKLDLNIDKELFKDEGGGEKLESILMFIEQYSKNEDNKCLKELLDSDFICTRNLLVTIASTAYLTDEFQFQAVRYKDVIFLYKIDKCWDSSGGNAQYGYKFEQYMTLDENGRENDPKTRVSNAEQEKVVVRTELKNGGETIKMFYGAEVDAIDSVGKYAECKAVSSQFNSFWYEKRSLKTFLQSYIGNIPTIVFGHHIKGYVYEVSKIPTATIPTMSPEIKWKPEVCIQKLYDILAQVKSDLVENGMAKWYTYGKKGMTSKTMEAKDCDYVGPSFIDKFD